MTDLTVPHLRRGTGRTPADGGCLLQIVDWIDRHAWTDRPPCVHPVLARLAIASNDRLRDGERQTLLDLIPRLRGTASDDPVLRVRLAVFCGRCVLPVWKSPGDDRPRQALDAAERWCDDPSEANRAAAYAAADNAADAAYAAYAADPPAAAALLRDTLDEYDRLTGRAEVEPVDLAPVARMLAEAR